MKTRLLLLIVLSVLVLFGLVGCSSSKSQPEAAESTLEPAVAPEASDTPEPTVAAEPTATPESRATPEFAATSEPGPISKPDLSQDPAAAVVLDMIARANAEDYAGAAELVTDDVMAYFIGLPPTGMEIYWGKDQFQSFLEECCTGQHFEWEATPVKVEDGVVYAEAKTWMDFTRQLGVAPNTWYEVYEVQDGKISLYTSTITEEALVKFRPALAEVMPEAFAVTPATDETPVSELTVTVANNTCTYDGPMNVKAGDLKVTVDAQDQNWEKYAVSFFKLDPDKDMLDLMASTHGSGSSWADMPFFRALTPGYRITYTGLNVEDGLLYMICWAGTPDTPIGNAGPFYVMP